MTDIVERARMFATAAHAAVGQLRKYTFEHYIVHPAEVAEIVASVGVPAMVSSHSPSGQEMSREDFDKLSHPARTEFFRSGGKITQ